MVTTPQRGLLLEKILAQGSYGAPFSPRGALLGHFSKTGGDLRPSLTINFILQPFVHAPV